MRRRIARWLIHALRRWLWLPWPTKPWLCESRTACTYPGHEPDVIDLARHEIVQLLEP